MQFQWHPDDPPPLIEEHSRAKLDVLRSYLRAYFDRLNVSPNREVFKLDLVDGFAGGGTFRDGGETVSGTSLIMLEEIKAAENRLNRGRAKSLRFDCKCYFVDKEAPHTDHLRKALDERGHRVDDESIVVSNGLFEDKIDAIIEEIKRRQPKVGRAIFLLDQTGFSQVALANIVRIFEELPAAEIILTFAADALINHLADDPAIVKAAAPLELTSEQIRQLIEYRNRDGGRALIQRVLRGHIRNVTGSTYDTPFFIRPRQSRRALWFLHLSRHPTARDVMIQRHWDLQNTFEHYGPGDFEMLGWDTLRDSETLPLFNFADIDAQQMHERLMNSMPRELFALASESPIPVSVMRHMFANRTAARFADLDKVLLALVQEREIEIRSPDGKVRSRALRHVQPDDLIAFPDTLLLPGFSRLG